MAQAYHKLFDEMRIAQKFNMPSPSYERIEIFLFNAEYYIHTTNFTSLDLAKHIIHHFTDNFWFDLVLQRLDQYRSILYS